MNKGKSSSIILGVVVVLLALIVFFVSSSKKTEAPTNVEDTSVVDSSTMPAEGNTDQPETAVVSTYTLDEVAVHNGESSCWSVVNSNVYDFTSWIGQHPGGEQAILSICGKDGSSVFNDQHGEFQKALDKLPDFLLGTLAQ